MFSPEELKAMEEVGTHSAEITEFVPLKTVRPRCISTGLLPRSGQGRRQALCAARARAARVGTLRARPLGRPRQAYIVMIRRSRTWLRDW